MIGTVDVLTYCHEKSLYDSAESGHLVAYLDRQQSAQSGHRENPVSYDGLFSEPIPTSPNTPYTNQRR